MHGLIDLMGFTDQAIMAEANLLKLKVDNGSKWTPRNTLRLQELVASGKNMKEISTIINKSVDCISTKMTQCKFKSQYVPPSTWNEKDIELLKNLKRKKKTTKEISKILNKTTDQISHKCTDLQIKRQFWSLEEDVNLIDLCSRNISAFEIGKILNKTEHQIKNRARTLKVKCITQSMKEIRDFYKKFGETNVTRLIAERTTSVKYNAGKREIDYNFEKEDLLEIYNKQNGLCFYTGLKMDIDNKDNYYVLSVDRLNSNIGYFKENMVLCCWMVNTMKMHFEIKEFLKMCNLITNKKLEIESFIGQSINNCVPVNLPENILSSTASTS